eukprot:scaffold7096_cov253-Pinguiococcus_pyrenoidosus.AAC.3
MNFQDIAMREDLRFDLRRSPLLAAASDACGSEHPGSKGSAQDAAHGDPGRSPGDVQRRNPVVLEILNELCNPRYWSR